MKMRRVCLLFSNLSSQSIKHLYTEMTNFNNIFDVGIGLQISTLISEWFVTQPAIRTRMNSIFWSPCKFSSQVAFLQAFPENQLQRLSVATYFEGSFGVRSQSAFFWDSSLYDEFTDYFWMISNGFLQFYKSPNCFTNNILWHLRLCYIFEQRWAFVVLFDHLRLFWENYVWTSNFFEHISLYLIIYNDHT